MQKIDLVRHYTLPELNKKLKTCSNVHHKGYWTILVYITMHPNLSALEYSKALGITKSKLYRIVQLYNKSGKTFLVGLGKWGGRRETTAYLTTEQEKQVLIKGWFTTTQLQAIILEKTNMKVSKSFVFKLLKKYKWEKYTFKKKPHIRWICHFKM